ncbi:Arc family DNA-binding protein [Litchfieldella xinjiangensis]|uniref:Arc family DNA-binding protein n=1 Tax=Litchfieldella xinjiangensis TaxID=1166948 RepID=UPI0009DFA3B3|nr:Arc family DNA-binding protein [Halomonas xinjiangensis]
MAAFIQTNVRLPQGIKEQLKREARANRRSLSAEITYRLDVSLRNEKRRRKTKD